MAEYRTEARPYLVQYRCDKCRSGLLRPTGATIVGPAGYHSFEHICSQCGDKIRLPHPYPCVIWECDGLEILRSPL